MIYAGILAGGKGTRMGNVQLPKQFLLIGDKPIIIHTIEKFLLNNKIDNIIIACPQDWYQYMKDLIIKYGIDFDQLEVIVGGEDRNETIMRIINHIENGIGLNLDDVLITHDAVRPFITQRIIEDNIKYGLQYDAVDTVIKSTDTIVMSNDNTFISDIPIRDYMFQGQTPQTFNITKLKSLYTSLNSNEKEILTDACKIFMIKGEKVKLVEGEYFNIKVTTPFDLTIANSIVKGETK